jgi:diacylglycerol kinase family enzyme
MVYLIVALVLCTILIAVFVALRWLQGKSDAIGAGSDALSRDALSYYFIINSTKSWANDVEDHIRAYFMTKSISAPNFLYTSRNSRGTDEAETALKEGADVIIAVGGDGTVRNVLKPLVGTNKVLGVIALGSGNILARNVGLHIPSKNLNHLHEALDVILHGSIKKIDLGFLSLNSAVEHVVLTIAGAGFDAEMIGATNDDVKRKFGFFAYFAAALKIFRTKKMHIDIELINPVLDAETPIESRNSDTNSSSNVIKLDDIQCRTVMVANCGKLPMLTLAHDAKIDDNLLDIVIVDTNAGLLGWLFLVLKIFVTRGREADSFAKISKVTRYQATRAKIAMNRDVLVQSDGELLGLYSQLDAKIIHEAVNLLIPKTKVDSLNTSTVVKYKEAEK